MISEYRKARALMADVAAQTKEGVWHNLFLEVEKVRGLPACRPPQNAKVLSVCQASVQMENGTADSQWKLVIIPDSACSDSPWPDALVVLFMPACLPYT